MKRKWHAVVLPLLAMILFLGTAWAAQKRPTTVAELALYKGPDRQQILEEGAKKEGKITLYTTAVEVGGIRPLVAAFNKKYPYIKVEVWRSGDDQLTAKIFEEYKARIYVADLMGVSQYTEAIFREKGILQPFYSPSLVHIAEGAISKASEGAAYAAGHYETGYGLAFNAKLIGKKDLPRSYQDLLDPKWKGKMVITGTSTAVKWMGTQLVTFGMEHVKKLVEQNITVQMVSARALLDMVISGEYVLSPAIGDAQVINSKKKGAPVDWLAQEPVHIALGSIMLAKNPPNPHAAMLFIDFDLSKEAGEVWKAAGYDSPRKDIPTERKYKKYYGAGSTKEYMEWHQLFDKLFLKK